MPTTSTTSLGFPRARSVGGCAVTPGPASAAAEVPPSRSGNWGEAARWLIQPPQHPVVANPVHSESSSDVIENHVQLAFVLLNDATASWLIKTATAEVHGEGAASGSWRRGVRADR